MLAKALSPRRAGLENALRQQSISDLQVFIRTQGPRVLFSVPKPIVDPTMPEVFPPVQGGGSLILAWQIKDKRVLVVGGGEVRH